MSTPREILNRAGNRAPTKEMPMAERKEAASETECVVVPQPIRQNSVYRQLMKSHDRVHTRHLKG